MHARGRGFGREGEEETYSVTSGIDNAFHAPTNGLESICADARSTLRKAFDSLAGFGREILCRLTTE